MDCSTPVFPVLHHLPELAQTHVHRVGDTIQLSHPLLSPSPPTFNAGDVRDVDSMLCWEDPLEESMATRSSILAWRIPWIEEPGGPQFMGSQKSQTQLSD